MTFLQTGLAKAAGTTGYQIARSLRFNSADSAYLNRTTGTASNRKTWTWSGWVKRSKLSTTQSIYGSSISGNATQIFFDSSDRLWLYGSVSASVVLSLLTTQVFRDTSAWYHIVVLLDTTQATAANRARMFVNGVEVTVFTTATYPTQNTDMLVNSANPHNIGRDPFSTSNLCDFYLTETYFIDGQGLTASSFGETDANTGVWIPKQVTGMTYGTNGYYINFSDNSGVTAATLGKDSSGNSNNYTPNNFSVTAGVGNDSLVDSPTNYGTDTGAGGEVRGNYATLNPLSSNTSMTLVNGNLDVSSGTTATNFNAYSSIAMSSGKFYCEVFMTTVTSATMIGVCPSTFDSSSARFYTLSGGVGYFNDGNKYVSNVASAYGATYTANDVIGIALDMNAQTVTFYKNGTSQGTISASLTAGVPYYFVTSDGSSSTGISQSWNFGQRPFAYAAPSGFKAVCSTNLPTPAIGATTATLANKNFDILLYSGDSTTPKTITGLNLQPDFLWLKSRTGGNNHTIYDAVRTVGSNKELSSNLTSAEGAASSSQYGYVNSLNSNGFSVTKGSDATFGYDLVNKSGQNYVAWTWKGANSTSSNTSGTITSTVSVNTTAGISIVTYTGTGANATVGHGLGVVPKMIITKSRNNANADAGLWDVYHANLTSAAYYLRLHTTDIQTVAATVWNSTAPTSSVFSIGSASGTNAGSSATYVAYCFAEVTGFSKLGSYTGNGSADGPFVYCGFKPRWIMIKRIDVAANWVIADTARDIYNSSGTLLYPNLSQIEDVLADQDILSNGFKLRTTNTARNASGGTYIFAAFAESPFNYSRAR